MLKDLLLSIATPLTLGRSHSRSSLALHIPAIVDIDEKGDSTMRKSPLHSRRTPKRRLSSESLPRTLRRKKCSSNTESNE